jgi:ribonuclease P protein component
VLPAANRLRTAADFRETTRRGVKAARGSVVVYLTVAAGAAVQETLEAGDGPAGKATSDVEPRVGVIVTKAVGGAVERHRAARRIRGAVRPLLGELPRGARMVVRALPGADTDPRLAADLVSSVTAVMAR